MQSHTAQLQFLIGILPHNVVSFRRAMFSRFRFQFQLLRFVFMNGISSQRFVFFQVSSHAESLTSAIFPCWVSRCFIFFPKWRYLSHISPYAHSQIVMLHTVLGIEPDIGFLHIVANTATSTDILFFHGLIMSDSTSNFFDEFFAT